MSIYNRIVERGNQLGLNSISAIEDKCQLKRKTIETWKKSTPKADNLYKVAIGLDVPMEYFFTETFVTVSEDDTSVMERLLLKYFKQLGDEAQLELVNQCKSIAKREEAVQTA